MYYQNYEDYMRSVLGYPRDAQDTYQMNYYNDEINRNYMEGMYQDTKDIEDLYPDIFKAINPYVVDICSRCNCPVTRDILEDMVEEVYQKVENNNEVMVNINIVNDSAIISREEENRSATQNTSNTANSQNNQISSTRTNYSRSNIQNNSSESLKRGMEGTENRENRETRQRRPHNNPFLRDLIKILILNKLLNNFPNRPNRPRPPRPPFPGRPRPTMPPRPGLRGDFDDYLRF